MPTTLYACPNPADWNPVGGSVPTVTITDGTDYCVEDDDDTDELDFVRPLIDAGMDVLDACLLYNACGKSLNAALAVLALQKLLFDRMRGMTPSPQKLAGDRAELKRAVEQLYAHLAERHD
jgi:hypothetical protein